MKFFKLQLKVQSCLEEEIPEIKPGTNSNNIESTNDQTGDSLNETLDDKEPKVLGKKVILKKIS